MRLQQMGDDDGLAYTVSNASNNNGRRLRSATAVLT
jgi:hypothetical protein